MRLPRLRTPVWGLMLIVALLAVGVNHFRPVTRAEAIQIGIAYTKRMQPQYRLEKFRITAHWISDMNFYVINWDNPANAEDTDTPNPLLVNHDGKCTEFLGTATYRFDQDNIVLDTYKPNGYEPFGSD